MLMNVSTCVWFCLQQQGVDEAELRAALEELAEAQKRDIGEEEIALVTQPAQGKTRFGGYADDIHGLSAVFVRASWVVSPSLLELCPNR